MGKASLSREMTLRQSSELKEEGCHMNIQGKHSPDRRLSEYKSPEAYMLRQEVERLGGKRTEDTGDESEGQPEARSGRAPWTMLRVFGYYSVCKRKPLGRFTVEQRHDRTR